MRYLLVAFVTFICITSCTKDTCNNPIAFNYDPDGESEENCIYGPVELSMEAVPYFGDEKLELETTYTTSDGRELSFDYVGIYLSDISFDQANGGGAISPVLDVMLVTADDYTLESVIYPQENLEGVDFTIGVDSNVYYIDPATYESGHPLASKVPTMYWSWATGYRYISLEGRVDTSPDGDQGMDGTFQYHIGLDPNLVNQSFSGSVVNLADNKASVSLKIDLSQVLANIDFTTEQVTHTMNDPALASKIAQNAANAISQR